MDCKKALVRTTLLLFALGLLAVNLIGVSGVPESPYIMVLPEKIFDEDLTPGMEFEVSIYTDYFNATDVDVWSWQFGLTFNPAVLEGVSVRNGDLITQEKIPDAWFVFESGTFNNIAGTLSTTRAYYDYQVPGPYYNTTYGPGTLAYVTFRVKSYGFSYIAFDIKDTQTDTVLIVSPHPHTSTETEISGYISSEQVGNGYFDNRILGDIDTNRAVNAVDLYRLGKAYESTNPDADINKDGIVDTNDLQLLNGNYGRKLSS